MKKIISLTIIVMLLLCGCSRVVVNNSDEIKMNKWEFSNENYENVLLEFNDDIVSFKVNSKDETVSTKIKGLCVIDSDKIVVYNEYDDENYVFKYNLKGDKLILEYMGGSITLFRVK